MTSADGVWKLERLGRWSDPGYLDVTRQRIAAYAEATNDEHPLHRSGEQAPPLFAVVGALMDTISPTMLAVAPPEVAKRAVHGAHDLRLYAPIVPGMRLTYRAAVTSIHGVSSGVLVVASAVTETKEGDLVAEQDATGFFRGATLEVSEGEAPARPTVSATDLGDPTAIVTHHIDADQTFRYSEASGDHNPIHLDPAAAAAVGLPGVIVHGLCTMAFSSRAVIDTFCRDDPSRLTRLAVRFAGMVAPEESITHTLWRAGQEEDAEMVAFETVSSSGTVAIKNGLALVGPAD